MFAGRAGGEGDVGVAFCWGGGVGGGVRVGGVGVRGGVGADAVAGCRWGEGGDFVG